MELAEIVKEKFVGENWRELGTLTGSFDLIRNHDRLLRALRFEDDDYGGYVFPMLVSIVARETENLDFIEDYLATKFELGGEVVSTAPSKARRIVFSPSVFEVPDQGVDPALVAVMMPFARDFEPVFAAIKGACEGVGLKCLRVKDIWEHSTIIQDVFGLIFRANVVVCDFSGRNANVFYEAGIAHTLGKQVVPLSQSAADVPFDLSHHRYLSYLNNGEGLAALTLGLAERLKVLVPPPQGDLF